MKYIDYNRCINCEFYTYNKCKLVRSLVINKRSKMCKMGEFNRKYKIL